MIACVLVLLAASAGTAVGSGGVHYKAHTKVVHATPAHYKVVPAVPVHTKVAHAEPAPVQYQVVPAQPSVEEVRKVVAGSSPGCSITSCSQVSDGCGWCEKDGGYAVGYEKNEEDFPAEKKKRTTLTLKKECKGVFVYDPSKCPAGSPPMAASPSTPPMPAPPAHPVAAPTPVETPVYYVAAEAPSHPAPAHVKAHHGHTYVVSG